MPTVFVASQGSHRRIFHTDRECPRLSRTKRKIQERDLDRLLEADPEWKECNFCSDTHDNPGWKSRHYQALKAAAAEGPT